MLNFMCTTCGVQYNKSNYPPMYCTICSEERQYINPNGQSWTTLQLMKEKNFQNIIRFEEENLFSIQTSPKFGIGQTAYLVKNKGFNLLWDCVSYIDEKTIEEIKRLGGLDAIAISHPHYYSSKIEWAEEFDVPVYIHEDDQEWVTRQSDKIIFWSGESLELDNGVNIRRLGGHYKGGSVLEWQTGNEQKGVLLTGDIIQVVADPKWVSFMYSYPNLIPLPAKKVKEISEVVETLKFDRIYNAFHGIVKENGKLVIHNSANRYIEALEGTLFDT
ncbi:MBL fold metallo-hydrolase [Gottfriedia sp. NPDC056225]|uniref:MBL fold metallo-hydrolase n=1 Tax=Gottfriedia sp. NPDC056225 TaxID=3345751 RepID=UPI00155881A3|nr:MBL fold metallo-hydrolase [Arthrobacter citreus]